MHPGLRPRSSACCRTTRRAWPWPTRLARRGGRSALACWHGGPVMFRGRVRHVHFVGIAGIGMSGLAEILRTLEFDVSGSDLKANDNTRRLESLGVRLFFGHSADNVAGADVVVYTSAVAAENPEIDRARE